MIKEKIIPIIEEREHLWIEGQDEWEEGIDQNHKKLIALFTEDINQSVEFLDNDCTADQFS